MGQIRALFLIAIFAIASCVGRGPLIGNNKPPSEPIPVVVPADYLSFPEIEKLPPVALKTRIYVESYTLLVENSGWGLDMNVMDARKPDEIEHDIALAEQVFQRIGLHLEVQGVTYIEPFTHLVKTPDDLAPYNKKVEAEDSAEELGIYYIFGHGSIPDFSGCAGFPWHNSKAFFVMGRLSNTYTVAHELGHHLGLFHTFEPSGDNVADTGDFDPPVIKGTKEFNEMVGNSAFDPCWDNVMTYTKADPLHLTDGQLRRAHYYLMQHRWYQLMTPTPGYNLHAVVSDAYANRFKVIDNRVKFLNQNPVPTVFKPL